MKAYTGKKMPFLFVCIFLVHSLFGQTNGRVVINEYMPWTSNGCGVTAEFVELLNFGPGSVDISCYMLTTGQYSITIPPKTILQPGEFYVLAGQDFIPGDCANTDSAASGVTADLNWNTCNCTDQPIPASGDGLMKDGGASNTPLVLFDPDMKIIDAVVRGLPAEPSTMLTSSGVGGCRAQTFDLGTMRVVYEELGMSAGRGNSFARTTDGDCGWVKDPKQSANASNNRNGDVSDIVYNFSLINATSCDSTGGRVSIYVEHNNYAAVFPMSYTVAIDRNNDGLFDERDEYSTYVDDSPPSVEASGLPIGHYRITVSSVKGCYLKTFEFSIIDCTKPLPVTLEYFSQEERNNHHFLEWKLRGIENLEGVFLQAASATGAWQNATTKKLETVRASGLYRAEIEAGETGQYFRLLWLSKSNDSFYSPVVFINQKPATTSIWPNPVAAQLNLQFKARPSGTLPYAVYNNTGQPVSRGVLRVNKQQTTASLDLHRLPPGMYRLQLGNEGSLPHSISFMKD